MLGGAEAGPADPFPSFGGLAPVVAVSWQDPGDMVRPVPGDHVASEADRLFLGKRVARVLIAADRPQQHRNGEETMGVDRVHALVDAAEGGRGDLARITVREGDLAL